MHTVIKLTKPLKWYQFKGKKLAAEYLKLYNQALSYEGTDRAFFIAINHPRAKEIHHEFYQTYNFFYDNGFWNLEVD